MTNKSPRRIIYVDAMIKDEHAKISLYDTVNNLTHILALQGAVTGSSAAERYAVVYAVMYAARHHYAHCHILNDNFGVVNEEVVKKFAHTEHVGLSWIPREINVVADRIVKLEPTVKDEEWFLLDMLMRRLYPS